MLSAEQKETMKRQLEAALQSLPDSSGSKKEMEPSESAPVIEDKELKKQKEKEQRELRAELTKMLVPLARIGNRQAMQEALDQGAALDKALVKSISPLVAAILAGKEEVALWLISHPKTKWSPSPAQWNGEIHAAIMADSPRLIEAIFATRAEKLPDDERQATLSMTQAMAQGKPRAAAWLWRNQKRIGKIKINDTRSQALATAMEEGLKEEARVITEVIKTMSSPTAREGSWSMAFGALLKKDREDMLAWWMSEEPEIVMGLDQRSEFHMMASRCDINTNFYGFPNAEFDLRQAPARLKKAIEQKIKMPLGLLAVAAGAERCAHLLANISPFKESMLGAQKDPQSYWWEVAWMGKGFMRMLETLEKIGFDVEAKDEDGWRGIDFHMQLGCASIRSMEKMGLLKSHWMDEPAGNGKTLFENARRGSYEVRKKADSWEIAAQKKALRSQSKPLRTKAAKQAKEKAKSRARL